MKLSKEFRIGFVTILVLALSVWGYNFLKGKNIIKPTDEYYVKFDRIDGLIESGNVFHKGYKVGNITSIRFDHQNTGDFIVKIVLEERIHIPRQSVVQVKSSSLIASASDLEIVFSNQNAFHSPGDTLLSEAGKGMAEMLEPIRKDFESVLRGVDTLLYKVNQVMNHQMQDDLRETVAGLKGVMAHLDYQLGPNGELRGTLNNFESISGNLADNNESITGTIQHMENISSALDSADLQRSLVALSESLEKMNSILHKVDNGEGSLGLLVNDSSLYVNLDSTAYHLDKLLIDLQEHPKRYVHFSLFGKSDKE